MSTTKEWTDEYGVSYEQSEEGITLVGISKESPLRRIEFRTHNYEIPTGVTKIGDSAFNGCVNLTCVVIPNTVIKIGESAFKGCIRLLTNVQEKDIPDSYKGNEHAEWVLLSTLFIPDSVTEIGDWAFSECKSLIHVKIPQSVTKIGKGVFNCCKNLQMVRIPNSVIEIGDNAFSGCISLKSVTLPKSTKIESYAFDKGVKKIKV